MIFHDICLPADNSHAISFLICKFWKSSKIWNCRLLQIIGGALWINKRVKILYLNIFIFQTWNMAWLSVTGLRMASSYRHGVVSPPRFRLSTQDIYHSLETGQMAPSYRHNGVVSPPRFRQSTQDIYHSLETGQHTAMTSALDRKWVGKSEYI